MIPSFKYENEDFDTEDHTAIGRVNEIDLKQSMDEVFYFDKLRLN